MRITPSPADPAEPANRPPMAVIDLSNPAPDEVPPAVQVADGLWKLELPALPVLMGHALDYHGDPDGPILTDGQMHQPGCVPELVCAGCDPEVIVAADPRFTFLIASHQRGCDRYAELVRRLAS